MRPRSFVADWHLLIQPGSQRENCFTAGWVTHRLDQGRRELLEVCPVKIIFALQIMVR